MKKTVLITLIVIAIGFQFIPIDRPAVTTDNPDDLLTNNQHIPDDIAQMLRNSCYDCHSNESHYPWYSYVSPVSLLVVRDIKLGREELNFSHWASIGKIKQAKLLDDIIDAVDDEEMPMAIYTPLHPEAKLNAEDRENLINWAEDYAERLFE